MAIANATFVAGGKAAVKDGGVTGPLATPFSPIKGNI